MGEFELRTADFDNVLQVSYPSVMLVVFDAGLHGGVFFGDNPTSVSCPCHKVFYKLPPPSAPLAGEYLADTLEYVRTRRFK